MLERGYIRIRPEYALRGWQGLPYALVQKGRKPLFMDAGAFRGSYYGRVKKVIEEHQES